jgi:hypothetical protein
MKGLKLGIDEIAINIRQTQVTERLPSHLSLMRIRTLSNQFIASAIPLAVAATP